MKEKENENVKNTANSPLFTGNYLRDGVVSECEKAAEASQAIFKAIEKAISKKNN